ALEVLALGRARLGRLGARRRDLRGGDHRRRGRLGGARRRGRRRLGGRRLGRRDRRAGRLRGRRGRGGWRGLRRRRGGRGGLGRWRLRDLGRRGVRLVGEPEERGLRLGVGGPEDLVEVLGRLALAAPAAGLGGAVERVVHVLRDRAVLPAEVGHGQPALGAAEARRRAPHLPERPVAL